MAEVLASVKGLVKRRVADTRSGKMHPPFVEAFVDRVQWILEERGWSMREFSARAGLEPTHLNTIIKKEREGRSLVAMVTVVKLARAAGVSLEWLATGEGPRAFIPDAVDPYPSRQRAARAARELGVSERAIEAVLAESLPPGQERRASWWFDRMRAQETLMGGDDPPALEPVSPVPIKSAVRPAHDKVPTTRKSRRG